MISSTPAPARCTFEVIECENKKEKKPKGSYKVKITFWDENNQTLSVKKITCLANQNLGNETNKEVLDVYSFNGIASKEAKKCLNDKNFTPEIAKEAQLIQTIVQDLIGQDKISKDSQSLIVADFKDFPKTKGSSTYSEEKSIRGAEDHLKNLFQNSTAITTKASTPALEFKNAEKGNLKHIINEGSLKFDILKTKLFSKEEKDFLQTTGEGSKGFCQFTEFFMNAFKFGDTVQVAIKEGILPDKKLVEQTIFEGNKYIANIDETKPYQPANKSTTIYPDSYKEIATKGIYTQAMQNSKVFSVRTEDQAGIVVMTTTKK